jgi:hypothetical protein
MENPGETLVGDYLRFILECDFVDFNVYTRKVQGEIDVIGINNTTKHVYICEVVTHLATGIQYTKNKRPDTGVRLARKFIKDIAYGKAAFDGYEKTYMLWSPVVKPSKGKDEYNQFIHLQQALDEVKKKTGVEIIKVINQEYVDAINALRHVAQSETKELKSSIMRFLQIEHYATSNLKRVEKANRINSHQPSIE